MLTLIIYYIDIRKKQNKKITRGYKDMKTEGQKESGLFDLLAKVALAMSTDAGDTPEIDGNAKVRAENEAQEASSNVSKSSDEGDGFDFMKMVSALAEAVGGISNNRRLVLNLDKKDTELARYIITTVEILAKLEDKLVELSEKAKEQGINGLHEGEFSGDKLKTVVTMVDAHGAHKVLKSSLSALLESLDEDGSDIVSSVEDSDYDGCPCPVCSIKSQLEEAGLLEDTED